MFVEYTAQRALDLRVVASTDEAPAQRSGEGSFGELRHEARDVWEWVGHQFALR
jgi:hypothetical protein